MKRRIAVLLKKEWQELVTRRALVLTLTLPPIIFLVIPFGLAVALPALLGDKAGDDGDLDRIFELMRGSSDSLAALSNVELFQVLMLRQFFIFLLFVPVMTAMNIATYSIVGEKVGRSLEPLLATPIRTDELILGKCLAAAIPAVLATLVCFGLYVGGVFLLTTRAVFDNVANATGLSVILAIAPLLTVLALSLGIITSSRSSDPRSAQQIAVVIILPLAALIVSQLAGLFLLTPGIVLIAAGVLLLIDLVVVRVGVTLFERETILTRWK